jgi:hypothetical protein
MYFSGFSSNYLSTLSESQNLPIALTMQSIVHTLVCTLHIPLHTFVHWTVSFLDLNLTRWHRSSNLSLKFWHKLQPLYRWHRWRSYRSSKGSTVYFINHVDFQFITNVVTLRNWQLLRTWDNNSSISISSRFVGNNNLYPKSEHHLLLRLEFVQNGWSRSPMQILHILRCILNCHFNKPPQFFS